MDEDLKAFGQRLCQLRLAAGLTQKELAWKLPVSVTLISRWERAWVYKGRRFKPARDAVVRLIEIFADRLTRIAAQGWARQAGHKLSQAELDKILPPAPVRREFPPLPDFYVERKQIEQTILNTVQYRQILVLLGPGGAGKTTLAAWAAQMLVDHFPDGVIWVESQPAEMVLSAQERIALSFGFILSGRSSAERAGELRSLLGDKRCLLVLDDLWAAPNIDHLRVVNDASRLLVTTRDDKVSHLLGTLPIHVNGLTQEEGQAVLAKWAEGDGGDSDLIELVGRLGRLPLALVLCGTQLQAGITASELLAHFRQEQPDLSILDMDDPQTRAESLTLCFDLSLHRLPPAMQERFAQLSWFEGAFDETASAAVWATNVAETRQTLHRLRRFALLEGGCNQPHVYWLHPLLRDYARQHLSARPVQEGATARRHAAWYIRYALYHPAVLDDVTDPAPDLDQTWADVAAGVKWAAIRAPHLATLAALLAHTERPALLEEVGLDLINAVTNYLSGSIPGTERAILYELQGDLYLLAGEFEDGSGSFEHAKAIWQAEEDSLAASYAALRLAGTYLLCQGQSDASTAARQAQALLAKCLPIASDDLERARWLFYWFDMIYNSLVRSPALPEDDVASLAELGEQTKQPILAARGWHIYRLWCTAEVRSQQADVQEKGRQLAIRAYRLWRRCGQEDRADDEISWSGYLLNGHYSQRAAARFAQRLSDTTPQVNQTQARLVEDKGINWWLRANRKQRIAWLSRMLPRYLDAKNCAAPALPPESRGWRWVDDILSIGTLGSEGRRFVVGTDPPAGHILNGPEWRVLSGQKALPLVGLVAVRLVNRHLVELERELN